MSRETPPNTHREWSFTFAQIALRSAEVGVTDIPGFPSLQPTITDERINVDRRNCP